MYFSAVIFMCIVATVAWGKGTSPLTIIDWLNVHGYHTFFNYMKQAGLVDVLNGTGPFTLFGPPNPFYYHLDPSITNDTKKLTDVIKYQVATGLYMAADMDVNEKQLESLQGSFQIRINHYYSVQKTTAEGQEVFGTDWVMSNGVIHFLRAPMIPPTGTVMEIISSDEDLSKFLSAISSVGMDSFFQDQEPITVFAPTDKAFGRLSSNALQVLRDNHTLLTSVLQYHVIPGTLYANGYHNTQLQTFYGSNTITLQQKSNHYIADGIVIDSKELSATNGVIHKIDQVLIPQSLLHQIQDPSSQTIFG